MAAVVEKSMQELTLDKVDAVESKVTELHVYGTTAADNAEVVKAVAQPGTPAGKQAPAALADTGEKAKKARRRQEEGQTRVGRGAGGPGQRQGAAGRQEEGAQGEAGGGPGLQRLLGHPSTPSSRRRGKVIV